MNFNQSNINTLIQLTGEKLIQKTLQNHFITINPSSKILKSALIKNSQFGTDFTTKLNFNTKEEFSTINNDKDNVINRKDTILSETSPVISNKKTKSAMHFNQIKNFSNAIQQITVNLNNNSNFITNNNFSSKRSSSPLNIYNKQINNSKNNTIENTECKLITDIGLINKIKIILSNHFLFNNISENLLTFLSNNFFSYDFPKNTIIYNEGDICNYFYILYKGQVEIFNKKKIPQKLKPFKTFGENSLLSKTNRENTVKSIENITVFVLDSKIYLDCLKKYADENYKEKFEFINNYSYFSSLDSISKFLLSEKMKTITFSENEKIISKNEMGNSMYIIKSGKVSCQIKKNEFRELGKSDYFGQNSILFDICRTMDVIAKEITICYQITRNDLVDVFGISYRHKILFSFFYNIIKNNEVLNNIIINNFVEDIYKSFSLKLYKNGEAIVNNCNKNSSSESFYELNKIPTLNEINQNDDQFLETINFQKNNSSSNKRIIIILDGNIYDKSTNIKIAGRNSIIGYDCIYDKTKILSENFIAKPDLISLEIEIEEFSKILEILFESKNDFNNKNNKKIKNPFKLLNNISKLQNHYLFKNLSKNILEKIAIKMEKIKYKKGEVIVDQNSIGNYFYLISKGKISVEKDGKIIRTLDSGNCFGEEQLLFPKSKIINEFHTYTFMAADMNVICYVLSKSDFSLIINDENIRNYLIKKISLQDDNIDLNNLYFINFLGKGKFGNVYLVHNKKNVYAIKTISRAMINKQKMLIQYLINEKNIMLNIDHPFIVKMVKTLKNNYFLFYLIEFINGVSFDKFLKIKKLNNLTQNYNELIFYSASLLMVIDYLHKKQIVHRDIKPNNIMIDSNGYLKIIDFGTAKVIKNYTSTIIGTPHYIAPEVLKGKGYSLSCDFWSIGVTLFEIYYGQFPFGNEATDILDIYKETINKKLSFPNFNKNKNKNVNNENVNNFLEKLLKKKVNERICNFSLLKEDVVFEKFEWDKLIDFQIVPPYVPQVDTININDKEYFEKYKINIDVYLEKQLIKNSFVNNDNVDLLKYEINDDKWFIEF